MATKNTAATTTANTEKVTVVLPRPRKGEEPTLFVGINGVSYLIPKGETVEVPPEVAFEIERAQAAEAFMFDQADEMQKAAK